MELFFLISWQQPTASGTATVTRDGLFTAGPGATRYTVLQQLKREMGIDGAITFFSLVRNEL